MTGKILILTLAFALAAPSLASARGHCERGSHDRRVTGTVVGAGAGALIGGALGHGAAAPLIGAAGGAVVGNQLSRRKCPSYYASYSRHHHHHYVNHG